MRSAGLKRPAEFKKEGSKITGSEVTAHLAAVVSDQLSRRGIEQKDSDDIAIHVMVEMSDQFGGQLVYFPKDSKIKTSELHMEIYTRYKNNELTIQEIVHEYDISIQWTYRIIKDVRAKLRKQHDDAFKAGGAEL